MPRGGYFGLFRQNPQADIYRSRWKRFYKRSYRPRTPFNLPEAPPPHPQPTWGRGDNEDQVHPDGVPSPWVLQYSLSNFEKLPTDARRTAQRHYDFNFRSFMNGAMKCSPNPVAQDVILRCLDRGRKGGADTGLGRPEAGLSWDDRAPIHLRNIFDTEAEKSDDGVQFLSILQNEGSNTDQFHNRRLYKLLEEKEIVWERGQLDVRKLSKRGAEGESDGSRGNFPFVDEQASLIDDLQLREILRLRHRINRRRHFKWIAIRYQYKKWHAQYLRRRDMVLDEAKARMGVLRQTAE